MSYLVVVVEKVPTDQGEVERARFLSRPPTKEDREQGLVSQADYIGMRRELLDDMYDPRVDHFRAGLKSAQEAADYSGGEVLSWQGARRRYGTQSWQRLDPSGAQVQQVSVREGMSL